MKVTYEHDRTCVGFIEDDEEPHQCAHLKEDMRCKFFLGNIVCDDLKIIIDIVPEIEAP